MVAEVGFFEKTEFERLTSVSDPIDFLSHKRHKLVTRHEADRRFSTLKRRLPLGSVRRGACSAGAVRRIDI